MNDHPDTTAVTTTIATPTPLSTNRLATPDEIDHAIIMLLSLGETVIADMVKSAAKLEMEAYQPLVVTDFAHVGEAQILLVPPGTHVVPQRTLTSTLRYIIGLSPNRRDYPTLILTETGVEEIYNFDTNESTPLQVCDGIHAKFANLRLDAMQPTIVETYIPGPAFSDRFFNVDCSRSVDIYNNSSLSLREGHAWAKSAYGNSMCNERHIVEKTIDSLQEASLNAVDAVFRPLVAIGEKIDKALGWK